ncbi:MAG: OmpA family protein [Rickettsiales bacterium]
MPHKYGFYFAFGLIAATNAAFAADIKLNIPGMANIPGISINNGASGNTASYMNAKMPGMDFSHKNLAGAIFLNAELMKSSFAGSVLTKADFTNAQLQGVDFSGADLRGANFLNADLSGANLTNANFSGALLLNAVLDGALANGTRFDGADLTNVDMSKLVRTSAVVVPVAVPVAPAPVGVVNAQAIATALKAPQKKIDLTINFDFNSDKLTTDGVRQVEQVASALKDASLTQSRFMIEGHTDNVGSDSYNNDLSYRRATRVLRTLTEQFGIEAPRLSSQGFGKTRPVASNDSELGRAQNRRVTIINLGN